MIIALIGNRDKSDFWGGQDAPECTLTVRLRNRGKAPEVSQGIAPGEGNVYLCRPKGGELFYVPGDNGVAVAFWAENEQSARMVADHVGGSGSPAERLALAYYDRRLEGAEGTLESLVNLVRDVPREARFAVVGWQAFSVADGVQVYAHGMPVVRSVAGTAIVLSQALLPGATCSKALDNEVGQRYGVIPYRCP